MMIQKKNTGSLGILGVVIGEKMDISQLKEVIIPEILNLIAPLLFLKIHGLTISKITLIHLCQV